MSSLYGGDGIDVTPFFDSSNIASGATLTPPASSKPVCVMRAKYAFIEVFVTALAGASGKVTFNFVARGHESQAYPTVPNIVIEATANGTTAVIVGHVQNCEAFYDIQLLSVVNAAGTDVSGITATCVFKT